MQETKQPTPEDSSKPIVHILTTGGTIASRIDPVTGAALPVIQPAELLEQVPALADIAEVRLTEMSLVSSWNVTPALLVSLAREINRILAEPQVAGVVVTHGTDTMEETAFALELLVDHPAPVILTGAMRNASLPSPDGPRNLLAAARVAVDPAARQLGALLVMNDEVHAARFVTKAHTTALQTFTSVNAGPIGVIDDQGLWLRWRPAPLTRLPLHEPAPKVYLIKMALGMEDLLLRAALEAGAAGIVIEGSGSGNVYGPWEEAIRDLQQAGIPVVLTSRCGAGRVVGAYGGPGGGKTLHDAGVISGGWLSGPKARLALMFALGAGFDLSAIKDYFAKLTA